MRKVIFVCTGNTCRSPMAEHILKHKLQALGVTGKEICVSSAGIMAQQNATIEPNSVQALKQLGIHASKTQKAKQLNKKLVTKDTVFITMTQEHKDWLQNFPNVYALSEFDSGVNIPDPFGQPLEAYLQVAKWLNFMLDEVAKKLVNNEI